VAAHPIESALLGDAGGCPRGDLVGVGSRMLIVFAPQVLFYGLAVVLYGILQSHRRFAAPALAPLLSSLVVVGAYAGFGVVGGAYVNRLHSLPTGAEYLLSLGTTLGVLAPGLIGYGLSANLSRVLYARGQNRAPAVAMCAGWLLVIVADLLIVPFVPRDRVVLALGAGTSVGLTVTGVALLVLVRRERGAAALAGVPRAFLAGLAGCAAGAAVGSAFSMVVRVHGFFPNVGVSIGVSAVVTAVFCAVVVDLDGGDLRTALRRLRTRVPAVEP
jgi:putative peptidoglycan lipid II flippase